MDLRFVEVNDKRLAVQPYGTYGVLKSAVDTLYVPYNSSSVSNSSSNVTVNVPQGTVLGNRIMLTHRIRVTLTGNATVSTNLIPTTTSGEIRLVAPRAYAMDNFTKSAQVQINNQLFSENLNNYVEATLPLLQSPDDAQRSDQSAQPTMGDNGVLYSDSDNTVASVFAPYYDNSFQNSRGSFPVTIVSNTPTSAILEYEITSPLRVSPFAWGKHATYTGLTQVSTVQINLNYDNNPARFFSASDTLDITNTQVDVLSMVANVLILTPRPEQLATYPARQEIGYYQNTTYITSMTPVTAGASGQVTSNALQLSVVPNTLLCWIEHDNNSKFITTPDVFFEITKCNIIFNGKSGILSSASEFALWALSENAGYYASYRDWQIPGGRGKGSVLVLRLGDSVPLPDGYCPGQNVNCNLQVQVEFRNPFGQTVSPQLMVMTVNEGVVSIEAQQVSVSVGPVSPYDYATAEPSNLTFIRPPTMFGAGWFDTFKKMASTGLDVARRALSFGRQHLPQAVQIAETIAPGSRASRALSEAQSASEYAKSRGFGVIGGRKIKRRALKY